MAKSPQVHPMAAAMAWVAKIIAAGMMMVLPGLAGQWLDKKLETSFLSLLGFAIGITLAITYLIAVSKSAGKTRCKPKE